MFLGLSTLTWVHTLLSLVGIACGIVVLRGLFSSQRLDGWTALFLASAVAASATGFALPAVNFGPSHWVGVISLVVLAFAILARYGRHAGRGADRQSAGLAGRVQGRVRRAEACLGSCARAPRR